MVSGVMWLVVVVVVLVVVVLVLVVMVVVSVLLLFFQRLSHIFTRTSVGLAKETRSLAATEHKRLRRYIQLH